MIAGFLQVGAENMGENSKWERNESSILTMTMATLTGDGDSNSNNTFQTDLHVGVGMKEEMGDAVDEEAAIDINLEIVTSGCRQFDGAGGEQGFQESAHGSG